MSSVRKKGRCIVCHTPADRTVWCDRCKQISRDITKIVGVRADLPSQTYTNAAEASDRLDVHTSRTRILSEYLDL